MAGLDAIAQLKSDQEANIDSIANSLLEDKEKADRAQALEGLTGQEKELEEAVNSGTFDIRGPLGQAFARSTDSKSEAYKSLRGWAAKRESRKQWAEARLENVIPHKGAEDDGEGVPLEARKVHVHPQGMGGGGLGRERVRGGEATRYGMLAARRRYGTSEHPYAARRLFVGASRQGRDVGADLRVDDFGDFEPDGAEERGGGAAS